MEIVKSILLVDDDKDDQEFFVDALNKIENAVLFGIANNGKEVLEILLNAIILPSIIFMDINMPIMTGIECLTEMKKHSALKAIPVIMLTTSFYQIEIVKKLGANAFLTKMANGRTLHDQLEQMIKIDFMNDSSLAEQTFINNAHKF
nr:response regulator [Pseudopedobacter sp.]